MKRLSGKRIFILTIFCMLWIPLAEEANATSDAQLKAIAEMGRLNGIALQCRYLQQVQRIKQELVLNLPKQRPLGDWFEQKTNESFMSFMQDDLNCPPEHDFEQEYQQAVATLKSEFKK